LHTTGLLKQQRPQKNIKKAKKDFEGQTQRPKFQKKINFSPDLDHLELMKNVFWVLGGGKG
jgi:hypothetical protein